MVATMIGINPGLRLQVRRTKGAEFPPNHSFEGMYPELIYLDSTDTNHKRKRHCALAEETGRRDMTAA